MANTGNICNFSPITNLSIKDLNNRFENIHRYLCFLAAGGGGGGTVTGANDGLSLSGGRAVLGQTIGQSGDPAALLENKEVPLNGNSLSISESGTNGTVTIDFINGTGINVNVNSTLLGAFPAVSIGDSAQSSGIGLALDAGASATITNQNGEVMRFFPSGDIGIGSGSSDSGTKLNIGGRTQTTSLSVGSPMSATAMIDIAPGTASAGTAPLKFQSGTLMTTPEEGAMEYDGSHLYMTIGSNRLPLDNQVDWFNVVTAGADNTGTADVSVIVSAALTAGERYIYFPAGTFLVSNTITLPDNTIIRGDGRDRTTIKLISNITAFQVGQTTGTKCQFRDFQFFGTDGTTGNTSQKGIVIDKQAGCYIYGVGGFFMGGFVFSITNNGLLSGNGFVQGNMISDCYTETCYGGVNLDVRGEYNVVIGSTFTDGTYGIYVKGGNNRIIGNNASLNGFNLYLDTGANDAHGVAAGNTFNHAGTDNVHANGIVNGFTLANNMYYTGNITIVNSTGIVFNGGDISVTTITSTSNSELVFNGCRFPTSPTWTITGNTPGVFQYGQGELGPTEGFVLYDSVHNKNFNVVQKDGVVQFTTGTGGQFDFNKTITGATGNADTTRDLCVGKSRFDLGSTTGDGVQIFKTGTNGSAFTVLDTGGNYAFTVIPQGRVAIGGNNNAPTAQLHIAAGTATASTAPLKLTAGTNLTTPENGAFEFDGTNLFFTVGGTRKTVTLT